MSTKPKILVTGANGQLGSEIRDITAKHSNFEFLLTTRDELPITDANKLNPFFSAHRPQYCINAAAYTAVDKAESKEGSVAAFEINAEAVLQIAELCKKYKTKLVHISTDYVFGGTASEPYKEDDAVNPVNLYGVSKLKGEEYAMQVTDAIVLRTSWVYSSYGNNFVKTMLRLMKEKESINVVDDQVGSPTYAADIAEVIMQMINFPHWQKGIYHYTNDGVISWYDFASAIREFSESACVVHPIKTDQYPTPAKRPAYSVLDKKKIQQVFGISLKHWMDSLAACLVRMKL